MSPGSPPRASAGGRTGAAAGALERAERRALGVPRCPRARALRRAHRPPLEADPTRVARQRGVGAGPGPGPDHAEMEAERALAAGRQARARTRAGPAGRACPCAARGGAPPGRVDARADAGGARARRRVRPDRLRRPRRRARHAAGTCGRARALQPAPPQRRGRRHARPDRVGRRPDPARSRDRGRRVPRARSSITPATRASASSARGSTSPTSTGAGSTSCSIWSATSATSTSSTADW